MADIANGQKPLRDGYYQGDGDGFHVDLRIDLEVSGLISADIFVLDPREFLASARTQPGAEVTASHGVWPAVVQSYDDSVVTGELAVDRVPDQEDRAVVRFRIDRSLNGLPVGVAVAVTVGWEIPEVRWLGLEVETEQGVVVPESVAVNGATTSLRSVLGQAGFLLRDIGAPTEIEPCPNGWGWEDGVLYGVLHQLMRDNAQGGGLDVPAWKIHLLQLARPAKPGLFGVMFDLEELLPRQGCAVFVNEIRRLLPEEYWDRRIVQTQAHEVGHAFNLAHRFEHAIGRADSTSVMNYPDRYVTGGESEYWLQSEFGLDPDELAFLRHGPRTAVMPGTAPFHSANYWMTATGTRSAFVPPAPTPGFRLELETPENGGVFAFGQPIFLSVSLANIDAQPLPIVPDMLDVKAGYLEILIERITGLGGGGGGDVRSFVPIAQRCYYSLATDHTPGPKLLAPGDPPLRSNLNLTFGATGFAMAEPGDYRLTPLLTVADTERVIRGSSLRARVAYPTSLEDERQGARLLRADVGAWFALGGSNVLTRAHDTVQEVLAERSLRPDGNDPIAAAISRSLAVHASRTYLRLDKRVFRPEPVAAAPALAERTLRALLNAGNLRSWFDRDTIAATEQLLAKVTAR